MKNKTIQIALPSIGDEELVAIREPLVSGWLTQGVKVAEFEEAFAKRHQVKHAIAVTSCTTGLHLALVALGIGAGDEVIVPSFTWVASANVVLYCGAKPVLIDVDPNTYNLDVKQLKSKLTKHTKAIIPVHLFGLCADMEAIKQIAGEIPLLEDAACAAGAEMNGKSAGSLGDIAVFSFHPRKIITTGEGGMITTNNDVLAEQMRQMRNHGASISEEQRHHGAKPYLLPDFNCLGFNYRMTDLQAVVGIEQLKKLDHFQEERHYWARYYAEQLAQLGWLQTPTIPEGWKHGWQAYVCLIDANKAPMPRNQMMEYLQSKGISTRPGTHAVHLLNFYKRNFSYMPEDFPMATLCEQQSIAIPLHNAMKPEDYDYIIDTLKNS